MNRRQPIVSRTVTPRERQVLDALRLRRTSAEIADALHISRRTVDSHVASLLAKFGVHDRRELARAAVGDDVYASPAESSRQAPASNPVNIAELDRAGVVVRVNASWTRFCLDNGGDPARCGPGVSYLQVCATAGDPDSRAVATYIRRAIGGGVFVPLLIRIPCHSPIRLRLYDLLVSSRVADDGRCVGATVALSEYRSAG